jgi:uncharacterized membrane-anchored protein YjiN (DUF445 family)
MHSSELETGQVDLALKRAQLSRMRTVATLSLVCVFVVLVASSIGIARYPALAWVRAFAEAATVGAIADWFAVVALFRHPLGLRIPHTAIIPRNKDRIGRSLGRFVELNFLTPENIVKKLTQAGIAARLAAWLSQRANSEIAAQRACSAIPPLLSALADDDMLRLIDRSVTPQLERLDAARLAARTLALFTAEGRHQQLLDAVLPVIARWLTANREMVLGKFGEMSRYTPQFVDRYIVDRLIAGIIDVLQQVARDPSHELRARFDAASAKFIDDLKHSPQYREQAEALKQDVLNHLKAHEYYRSLWRAGRQHVLQDLASEGSVIRQQLTEVLMAFGSSLSQDEPLQRKLDDWIERAVETLAVRNRHEISLLIEDIVRGWNARDMAEKAELEIGRDLQYIRINGMLVGGLVGLVLHALYKLL